MQSAAATYSFTYFFTYLGTYARMWNSRRVEDRGRSDRSRDDYDSRSRSDLDRRGSSNRRGNTSQLDSQLHESERSSDRRAWGDRDGGTPIAWDRSSTPLRQVS